MTKPILGIHIFNPVMKINLEKRKINKNKSTSYKLQTIFPISYFCAMPNKHQIRLFMLPVVTAVT